METKVHSFKPGFRFSIADAFVLLIGGAAGAVALGFDHLLGAATWYVLVHFFLFCNVLRMARALELAWASAFVCLAGASVRFDIIPLNAAIACSLLTTGILAAVELRKPSYHGVGWQRINPRLLEWWRARVASGS